MLALICGTGDLPRVLYQALEEKPFVAALEGFAPKAIPLDQSFRLETLGTLIADLAARGVNEVCFVGTIQRPTLDPTRLDPATMPLVPRIMSALQAGDDGALRVVIAFFEEAGIAVRGAHELLPDLLPPQGVLTIEQPEGLEPDMARAGEVLSAMGTADLGQSCVICKGQVLAVEAVLGTDWMLGMIAAARSETAVQPMPDPLHQGGFLYKAAKPEQDLRVDMPVIGPVTLDNAARAGLDGVVIQADTVMLLDRAAAIVRAKDLGLFLWVRP